MQMPERETYRLRARLPVFARRQAAARAIVRRAIDDTPGPWAICASGGKDSVALIDLALGAGWRGPVVHYVTRGEMPADNTALLRALCRERGLMLHEVAVPGPWECWEAVGYFFVRAETAAEKTAYRRYELDWSAANAYAVAQGWRGQMLGMRGPESKRRRRVFAQRGPIYQTRSRATVTACPLARWEAADVWAYLVARDLPWLAVYDDAPRGREAERSEFTWFEESLWRHGQAHEYARRFPARWQAICARWPEARDYL